MALSNAERKTNDMLAINGGAKIRETQFPKRHLFGEEERAVAVKLFDAAIESGAYSAAVQAEYRRGQAADLYVSRSEIRHGSIDSMSKADVEKAILDIKRQLGEEPRIIEGEVIEPEAGKPVLESVKVGTPESS